MDELVIRRCTFRVVRRGGWSWGGDRRALVDRMTRLAPQLIAAQLAELFADREGIVTEPVRLRIRLPAGALHDDRLLADALRAHLTDSPAVSSIAAEAAGSPENGERNTGSIASGEAPSGPPSALLAAPKGLRALLLQWRDSGQLLRRLDGISRATAELWIAYLTQNPPAHSRAGHQVKTRTEEARSIHDRLTAALPGPDRDAAIRLAVLVEMLARHRTALAPPDIAALLDPLDWAPDSLPVRPPPARPDKPSARNRPDGAPAVRSTDASMSASATILPAVSPRKSATGTEVELTSVLPFLAMGMLARVGWLDVAAASLEAIALPDNGAVLAAALAERLVPPAGPSMREAEARKRTVACFAGVEHAPTPAAFAAWNRVAGDGLGALTSFVADEIAEGHNAEMPLLVSRLSADRNAPFVLFDADGHYPVALASDLSALLPLLDRFRASILLVARNAATPALVESLNRRGQAFVSDAPPGRGEQAQRLRGGNALWCSAHAMPDARIASAAAEFEMLLDASGSSLSRLLPESEPSALMVTAYLSAAMGLGLLGWKLWRKREPPSPLLALDRLASLDGTARFMPDALEIRPSIGRRYLDLKQCGALAEIQGVPWLGGRRIRFSGP